MTLDDIDLFSRLSYRLGYAAAVIGPDGTGRVVGPFLDRLGAEGKLAPQAISPYADSPYLTVEEAAAYCRLAVGTIYNRRREIQRMPGTGKLLFRREDLDAWLRTRRRKR